MRVCVCVLVCVCVCVCVCVFYLTYAQKQIIIHAQKNITHTLLSLHTYKESTQFTSHTRRKSIHIPFFDPALHTNTNTERYQHIHEGRGDSNSFILHLMCTCLIVLDWTTTTLPTPSPTPSTSSSGRRSIDEVYTFDILSVTDV